MKLIEPRFFIKYPNFISVLLKSPLIGWSDVIEKMENTTLLHVVFIITDGNQRVIPYSKYF